VRLPAGASRRVVVAGAVSALVVAAATVFTVRTYDAAARHGDRAVAEKVSGVAGAEAVAAPIQELRAA
jgi:hypothetical protein